MYKQTRYNGVNDALKVSEYVSKELIAIEQSFYNQDEFTLTQLYVAPKKPRDGLTVLADGVSWNPGAGQGVYTWYAAAWHKLG